MVPFNHNGSPFRFRKSQPKLGAGWRLAIGVRLGQIHLDHVLDPRSETSGFGFLAFDDPVLQHRGLGDGRAVLPRV